MHGLPKEEDKYYRRRITYRKQSEVEEISSETFSQFGANKGLGDNYAFEEMALPYLLPCQRNREI